MSYFDHASTSFPKPPQVMERIQEYLTTFGVSPGRGSYKFALKAEELVENTRCKLAKLLEVSSSNKISFTMNATHGLNIVLKGHLKRGDHVLLCQNSHNATLRPLGRLARELPITYDVVPVSESGEISLDFLRTRIRPNTALAVFTGASNVLGVLSDINPALKFCQENGIQTMLDSTQSLGYTRLGCEEDGFDFVVGTGHKSLLGPSGVGFLYVKDASRLRTFLEGSSHGNNSNSPYHPERMPYKFEAGTMNSVGVAGLFGALEYIEEHTFAKLHNKALISTKRLWDALSTLEGVKLFGTSDFNKKVPIISLTMEGMLPGALAHSLDEEYGICTRAGLHCAPLTHTAIGTMPTGTLRISVGHQNSDAEIERLIHAMHEFTQVKVC